MLRRSCSWPPCNTCDLFVCTSCSTRDFCSFSEHHPIMSSRVPRILLYVLRRDVRLSDNPIFHAAALQTARQTSWRNSANSERRHRDDSLTSEHGGASFTHLLPVYVWSANQIEVSGFLPASTPSPY